MYDVRQFRPTLYAVLFIGTTGFAVAAQTPALWLLAVVLIGLNAWLVLSDRFSPLPRWLTNAITLLAATYIASRVYTWHAPPLMYIGQFLLLLQIVKLFEQRANRDYGQILVLSLLLAVAASLNATSLTYAVLLGLYLITALYCCLLFHLKVEADRAAVALPAPVERINPTVLRRDQQFLSRSMRRLTGLVAIVSVVSAVVVFTFFPRGAGAGVLGQFQLNFPQALTGFSDRMSYEHVARIMQNNAIVAHAAAWHNGRAATGQTLYLRGLTLDAYGLSPQQWARTSQQDDRREIHENQATSIFRTVSNPPWRLTVTLEPSASGTLFFIEGLVRITSSRGMLVRASAGDESIHAIDRTMGRLDYEAWSTGTVPPPALSERLVAQMLALPPPSNPGILAEVRRFTRRPEIVGQPGMDRPLLPPFHPDNRAIAQRIEDFLQRQYSYTLDLTDVDERHRRSDRPADDPIVRFLTDFKRGHCQYFAGAMVLMCQSLGIPARVVVGFKTEEYNAVGGYYIARQSHAHAWVEVLTDGGWERFDPTSGQLYRAQKSGGFWQSIKHFFDFLEFKWGENVIAFDRRMQDSVVAVVDRGAFDLVRRLNRLVTSVREWFGSSPFWQLSSGLLGLLIWLMVLVMAVAVLVYLIQQVRLRRRARRIGIDSLPHSDAMRLARQLAFYDELTLLLERRRLVRPRTLTHREFADSLSFLPLEVYDSTRRLTEIFYRVRFGGATVSFTRQHRLLTVVARLSAALSGAPPVRRSP